MKIDGIAVNGGGNGGNFGILSNNQLWLYFHFFTNSISLKFISLEDIGVVKYCDQKQHDA